MTHSTHVSFSLNALFFVMFLTLHCGNIFLEYSLFASILSGVILGFFYQMYLTYIPLEVFDDF